MAEFTHEIRIDASPEVVFALLTDPAEITRWMGLEAELDPRPGGIYRLRVTANHTIRGEFREVDAPKRVVFTFGWEQPDAIPAGSTTVEYTLTPDGDGTVLRLVHSGLPDEVLASHAEGWEHFMPRLVEAGAGRDPGPDPWTEED